MGRGYSGNHPRYSRHSDERYDAKEAYNKDLTASARLHYLENDRHDHESPAHRHTRSHRLRERAMRISERSGAERGDEYDYENPKVMKLVEKAKKLDERSGVNEFIQEAMQEETNRMIDERGGFGKTSDIAPQNMYDSPMNACAKSEGGSGCIKQMGGAWRVISNKTDKPWPAKYGSESKAKAALRGYHAG